MMTYTHGGNLTKLAALSGRLPEEIVDFSASINPLGPPEWLRRLVSRSIEQLRHYPDPEAAALVNGVADNFGVSPDRVVVGNGSTELLYVLPRIVQKHRAVIPVPAYNDYASAARLAGLEIVPVPLPESDGFRLDLQALDACLTGDEIVFLGQPNNPTGRSVDRAELIALVDSRPDTFFVVDESFAQFMDNYDSVALHIAENLVVVQSLTKFFAIPGLRLGCGCASKAMAALLRKHILPWTVNTLAQEVGVKALQDKQYAQRTKAEVSRLRQDMVQQLGGIFGLKVYPSEVNFLLVCIENRAMDAVTLAQKMLSEGIAIRDCANFKGLPDEGRYYFRIAVRCNDENELLYQALRRVLRSEPRSAKKQRRFSLMLQGTTSNAGKSILTAAFCRILFQDGVKVAPFKAQNMSLNSFVTRDGLEMGRAQVVQAQACRLDPDVRMNPVLLKPSGETGCQVVLNGKPVNTMGVNQYISYKEQAWPIVTEAYDSLAADYDLIVLEGAGSSAEVNLKSHDIVNMRMAEYADSAVLLVGDIDRGGVFASFVGHHDIFENWERALLTGFLVNRFRGDASLLADAYEYMEDRCDRPVLGTVPYIRDLGLPEEDSVGFKNGLFERSAPNGDHIRIAVIDLPHISNFTDVESLLNEPDVHLLVARKPEDLAGVHCVILPGTKNVITDLSFLKTTGLYIAIKEMAQAGKIEIVGICGGFQMLGNAIADPFCIEAVDDLPVHGLGLLDMETELAEDKTLSLRRGIHKKSNLQVHGYEIHHGRTRITHDRGATVCALEGEDDPADWGSQNVWGTYLHGIFDGDQFRRWFIDQIRHRNGLAKLEKVQAPYDLEPAFDRLADVVRESCDMDRIYALLGL